MWLSPGCCALTEEVVDDRLVIGDSDIFCIFLYVWVAAIGLFASRPLKTAISWLEP